MKDQGPDLRTTAQALFWIAGFLAIALPALLLFAYGQSGISELGLGGWGDFLAGAFGPAALLILSAGFLLQREELRLQRDELRQTRETLNEQRNELEKTAENSFKLNNIMMIQAKLAEWEAIKSDIGFLVLAIVQNTRTIIFNNITPSEFSEREMCVHVARRILTNGNIFMGLSKDNPVFEYNIFCNLAEAYCIRIHNFMVSVESIGIIDPRVFLETAEGAIFGSLNRWLQSEGIDIEKKREC